MHPTVPTRLRIQLRGLKNSGGLDATIEQHLRRLSTLVPVSDARVLLERQQELKPPFRVLAFLAVPGPDIHAEARDCTLPAAWRKLAADLKRQFDRRWARQELRLKGREQCRRVTSQWHRGP